MQRFILLMLCCAVVSLNAQTETNEIHTEIDQLKAPQSPAAVLAGISESEVIRPSDVSDFAASIRQASNNFTTIPLNYAVEFAPYWLFKKNKVQAKDFRSNEVAHNIKQSFTISVADNNNNLQTIGNGSISNTALALGMRFSILLGKIADDTQESLNTLQGFAQKAVSSSSLNDQSKQTVDTMQFTRTGFKLDCNAAVAWQFPDQLYSHRQFNQAASWIGFGYEWESHISFLTLARYQYFAKDTLIGRPQNSGLDAGARLIYTQNNFSLSAELVYRNNKGIADQKYKYLINLDYKIGDNQKLNLSIGKDFNNAFSESGNVISALNFLMGLGNKRKIHDSSL